MAGTIAPFPKHMFFTNAGAPAAGYYLHTFAAGTSTQAATYTDSALSVANANPIVLDASGRCTIYLRPGTSYKFQLALSTDATPPASPIWSQDNIDAVPPGSTSADVDSTATAGETLAAGEAVYWSDGSGGLTAGRVYKTDADNGYSSSTAYKTGFATEAISTGASGTIRTEGRVTGLSGLTAGQVLYASATAGALTNTAPSNARLLGIADSTTSLIIAQRSNDASSTVGGQVSTGAQTFAGAKTLSSLLTLSGGAAFTASSILNFAYSRSTADVTKNANTTLVDVTGLSFSVGASETWVYLFVCHGICQTAADWKIALTAPSAPTAIRYGLIRPIPTATTASTTTAGTGLVGEASAAEEMFIVAGILRNGANAGTIQLQMAQNTSDATNTILRADSYVIALRVA